MVQNGLQQIGARRIGKISELIMSQHLHMDINSWQHMLDVLCKEAVCHGQFK